MILVIRFVKSFVKKDLLPTSESLEATGVISKLFLLLNSTSPATKLDGKKELYDTSLSNPSCEDAAIPTFNSMDNFKKPELLRVSMDRSHTIICSEGKPASFNISMTARTTSVRVPPVSE